MKKTLVLAALLLCLVLKACQCSDKPPVGPVEGEDEAQVTATGARPAHA
jgi:hypothetical protein